VLTPYKNAERIDQGALERSSMMPSTWPASDRKQSIFGAVILTARRCGARNRSDRGIVAERAGDFRLRHGGHHMEAMLAAFASGAARVSATRASGCSISIGGGTTKLAIIRVGARRGHGAFHVGGRLQSLDGTRIVRLDPAGGASRPVRVSPGRGPM